jgi:DNA polymerase elongation subunit (family B)
MASIDGTTTMKNYTNKVGETIRMPHPNHTLVLDMMEVIDSYDLSVMGMKESMNLDYVAGQTLGAHKIEYEGSLQDLYEADYQRYVFYNAIDSILVQLIDKRFKTMNQFYLESLICKESIGKCFSKIALTEALIFKQFYKEGIKIVYEPKEDIERGELMGAYVKDPKPGKWEWMCCNDFASLYPSTMITCNISFENYLGKLGREFTEEEVERFRKDKNYFVSVNNNVYRNDRPYTLKVIERSLKEERDVNKYLSKKLDATIKRDLTHFVNGQDVEYKDYTDDVRKYIKDTFDLVITNSHELDKISDTAYFMKTLDDDITYLTGLEQAVKTLMNSIYGGSSHVSFYFYNMDMANDITGESRWLIHKMEEHIPKHFNEEWLGMKELHKELGIEVDEKKVNECLKYGEDMVKLIYGDTDSLYSSYNQLLKTIKGYDTMSTKEKLNIVLGINLKYLDDHNCEYIKKLYDVRHGDSFHKFELETVAKAGVWLNVKKRYGQMLLWKDGKFFDEDDLPIKVKGLEVIKASYPTLARKINKDFLKFLLEYEGRYLSQELTLLNRKYIKEFEEAPLENICLNTKVNKYAKHIINDKDPSGIKFANGASYNSKALGLYNWLNNVHKFGSEPLYGGKVKCYTVKGSSEKTGDTYFAFESMKYPQWANEYAPVDRMRMYDKYVLSPFNRILEAIGMPVLNIDGSIQLGLFG